MTLFVFGIKVQAQNRTTIKVLDATIKDAVVTGAEVYIQKNGSQTVLGTTNAAGEMVTGQAFDDDENTLIIIKKKGYSTLVVKCPCQGYTYALSPSLADNGSIRVVLSWGQQPADLDIHAVYGDQHVYYGNKVGAKAALDVDDRDGYGPETITVTERVSDLYGFLVRDYTNRKNQSDALSKSNAKVFVYRGDSLIKTYYVPTGQLGNLWRVFTIDRNNQIVDYNSMVYTSYFGSDSDPESTATAVPSDALAAMPAGLDHVEHGEKAYARKEYELSIKLYQKALNEAGGMLRPRIINNIALSQLKLAKYQECIETSTRIFNLNESTAQDKANAHYNTGLAYEKQLRYKEAAQSFQKAANTVSSNAAYMSALKRVRKQIK
ncbi:hypothetical protein DBR32_06505 [Taibaiella sp. KBW10]|nr:hypothetical protein DBR32_06505 [Taibaiella sp. KBW10]